MKKHKRDLISENDFTKIILKKDKHHYPLPDEVIPEDENTDPLKETLVGMEYDIESEEDILNTDDEDLEYLMSEVEKKADKYEESLK